MGKDFEQEYLKCKEKPNDIEKANCLISLLHEITELQDHIQLAIPPINESVALSKSLTNDANALLLEASRQRMDIRKQIENGYTKEKVENIIRDWNWIVHDYNITHPKEKHEKQLECKWVEEFPKDWKPIWEIVPEKEREKTKRLALEEIYKDQEKLEKR